MAASDYTNQIQQIYLAYLGRPADPAGLTYWADQVDSRGGDLSLVLPALPLRKSPQPCMAK